MALMGSFFNSINCCTNASVSLKINLLRSKVPKIFDAALNLLPFTFSKSNAGPFAWCTRKCIAESSK